jgi:hypothetical protein
VWGVEGESEGGDGWSLIELEMVDVGQKDKVRSKVRSMSGGVCTEPEPHRQRESQTGHGE